MRYVPRRRRDAGRGVRTDSRLFGVTAEHAEAMLGLPNTVFIVRDAVSGQWGALCNLCNGSLEGRFERSQEAALHLGIHLERRHAHAPDVALGIYEPLELPATGAARGAATAPAAARAAPGADTA
jgi:hypothetical protein